MAPYYLKLDIPAVPPSPNRILGKHWSTKAKVKNEWLLLVRSQYLPSGRSKEKRRAVITLYHARLYDKDNLYASVKPVVDSLVHWGILKNDNEDWVDLEVSQRVSKPKDAHTEIEVRALRPKVCDRHPRRVYYDGKECPACKEIRTLPPSTRAKLFAS